MPRKPQQRRSKETVNEILEAGFIALAKHGRDGTTTRQIAEIAGIGVGSLYEYFANKEEIYDAMLERVVRDVVAMLEPRIPNLVRMSVSDAVIDLLYQFKELMERNGGLYLQCAPYAVQVDPRKHLGPIEKVLLDLFMQYVMHNPETMRIRDIPTVAYIIVNGGVFTIIRYLVSPNPSLNFDQLANGLSTMIASFVEAEMKKAN